MRSGLRNDTIPLSLLSACKYSHRRPLCLHGEGSLEMSIQSRSLAPALVGAGTWYNSSGAGNCG